MARARARQITNCNVYQDGENFLGSAETVTLPELRRIMLDHKGLGMAAAVELPTRGRDKMEAKIKWNSVIPEAFRRNLGGSPVALQVRSAMEEIDADGVAAELPVFFAFTGIEKSTALGEFKQNEKVMPEQTFAVYYAKLEVDGVLVFEVDALANVWKVGTEDVLGRFRSILGG